LIGGDFGAASTKQMFDVQIERRAQSMIGLSHWRGGNFEVESVKFFGGLAVPYSKWHGLPDPLPVNHSWRFAPFLLKAEEAWNLLPWRV